MKIEINKINHSSQNKKFKTKKISKLLKSKKLQSDSNQLKLSKLMKKK